MPYKYTREGIEEFISGLPEKRQQRMRQFQWRIDNELRRYKDPVARMNRMVEMMWEGVGHLSFALNTLADNIGEPENKPNLTLVKGEKNV